MRAHNLGVLVISHDAPLLDRLCQRVVTMLPLPDERSNVIAAPPRD